MTNDQAHSKHERPEPIFLARFSIFEDFKENPEVLARFEKILKPCEFPPGTLILQEGTIGSEMFLLTKGHVAVTKKTPSGDEYKVAELSDSMNIFFGEGALLDVENRSATIRALSQCECFTLNRENFEAFSVEYPEYALPVFKKIARAVMARFRKTNQDFLLLYNALVAEIRGH